MENLLVPLSTNEVSDVFNDLAQHELKNAQLALQLKINNSSFDITWENGVSQLNASLQQPDINPAPFSNLFNMIFAQRDEINNLRQTLHLVLSCMAEQKDHEDLIKRKKLEASRAKANQRAAAKRKLQSQVVFVENAPVV